MTTPEGISTDEYLKEREAIRLMEGESAKTFDKGILTLSAGALAISVTAVHKEFPLGPTWFLVVSWVFFCVAIFINLTSQLVHMASCRWAHRCLDELRSSGKRERSPYGIWIKWLNISSIGCFILGIAFMIVFGAKGIAAGR